MVGDGGIGEAVGDPPGDGLTDLESTWADFVERVVADVGTNFGSPVANEIAGVLDDHRAEAEAAIRGPLTLDAQLAAAESDRREAAELVRDAVSNWRVARTESESHAEAVRAQAEAEAEAVRQGIASIRAEADLELDAVRADMEALRNHINDLQAPLDAREAELVAWEVELRARAAALGSEAPREPRTTPRVDRAEIDDPGHRTQWASPAEPEPGAGRRGWGRHPRPESGNPDPAR